MQSQPPKAAPRKSAFAAAFFSLLFPGLGQAYLGLWSRAFGWAALPILVTVLVGGMAVNGASSSQVKDAVFDQNVQLGVLVFLVIDVVYRLFAMLDAYRLARAPDRGSRATGLLSAVGFLAILLVLVLSHVAVARPIMVYRDSVNDITGGTYDTPVASGEISLDPSVFGGDIGQPFTQPPSPTPNPSAPPPEPTDTPEPTPTQGPSWDEGGRLNILLVGADAGRAGYSNYLTDTMLLVSIDTETKQTAFISLPRDTQNLPIPKSWPAYRAFGGVFPYKANTDHTYAARLRPDLFPGSAKNKGFNALKGMLGELYGMPIDYFVAVDLHSFRDVINDLDGVMIDVQNPVYDYHYPADNGDGHFKLYIPPGYQWMDGARALSYARARHVTSDFDRVARQQRVITSVREQLDLSSLLAPGVIQDLLGTFRKSIKTDIPPDKIPKLIQLAQGIDLDKRISLVLDPPDYSQTCYPCPPDGLYVLKANVPKIRKDVQNIFKKDRAEVERATVMKGEGAVVNVVNGSGGTNVKTTRLAEALDALGVSAVVPPVNGGAADRSDYTDTVITVYNGAEQAMPETISFLEDTLGVTAQTATDDTQQADIVIIVGANTKAIK
ncbi:MAG: LCP family protein [Chloroflexota bacterium]